MNFNDVLLIALLLLYIKWIAVIVLYPLLAFYGLYNRHKSNMVFKMLAFPGWCIERILRFGGGRFVIYHIGNIPSIHVRSVLYRGLGVRAEANVVFHFGTEIRAPWLLDIGKGSIIGDNAILDARSKLKIGRNVNLSSNVSIYTLQHDYKDPDFNCQSPADRKMSVEIDDRAWLGANVIVLPGVHIGEGAVCCAGCVVTKDVAPYTVVAGIPAAEVGGRPRTLRYEFNGTSCRLY